MSDNEQKEFGDFVDAGLPLIKARDDNAWALGKLAADFVETCVKGRPAGDSDAPTLGDLASAWDVRKPLVSEWRNTHLFFPDNVRTAELSWSHHNMARQRAGGDMEEALDALEVAKAQHMGIAAFRRYLRGIYFEGPLPVIKMPIELHGLVPYGEKEVWAVFKRRDT